MEIRKIEYRNVYGAFTDVLTFQQGENFLVGINGCGKSTVLNLIHWILGPSLPDLCSLQHDLIKLDVKHNNYIYSIQSRILEDSHELKVVTRDKTRKFNTIKSPLVVKPNRIHRSELDDIKTTYAHYTPEQQELTTWNFIQKELSSPVFIGLKRSIQENSYDQSLRKKTRYPTIRTRSSNLPVRAATTLMRDAFNTNKQKLVEINDELNRNVLELSFSGVLKGKLGPAPISLTNTAKMITRLKRKFLNINSKSGYSKTLYDSRVQNAGILYLDSLAELVENTDKENEVWLMLNQHNFDRASKMFDLFEKHENKVNEAQLEIINFSTAVNRFLEDSGKSIHFNYNTGIPFFKAIGFQDTLSLSQLSSGETQIVILLSYFAFLAKKGIPIVIDEPELSLHVQWQKYFVTAIKEVMPDKCQTIMATHSPEICGAEDVNVQSISVFDRAKK